MGRLQGKVALVTGAAQGIGAGIARAMAREGAAVIAADRNVAGVEALAAEIGAEPLALDVTSEADWAKAAANIDAAHGKLSILVNNAGVELVKPMTEHSLADWRGLMAVNVDGLFLGCRSFQALLAKGGGEGRPASVINISSIAGLAAGPGMGAYNATKAGVWMYTKTIALEAAKADWNVRCNSVHPVFIKTPILDPFIAMAGGDEDKAHERLARGIPLKRIGEPDDVAYCVLYLASDESKFVTGSEFKIDGGMTAQ